MHHNPSTPRLHMNACMLMYRLRRLRYEMREDVLFHRVFGRESLRA